MPQPSLILLPPSGYSAQGVVPKKIKISPREAPQRKVRHYTRDTPRKTIIPRGFDMVSTIRHRMDLPTLLGIKLLAVYDTLRSLIWRKTESGNPFLREAITVGVLAAKGSEREIARHSGVTATKVKECLKRLQAMGWITPYVPGVDASRYELPNGVRVWELGSRAKQGGKWQEQMHSSSVQDAWYEAMDLKSLAYWGLDYRKTSPATQLETATDVLIDINVIKPPKAPRPRQKSAAGIPMALDTMLAYAESFAGLRVDPRVYGPQADYENSDAWFCAPQWFEARIEELGESGESGESEEITDHMFSDAAEEATSQAATSRTIWSENEPKKAQKTRIPLEKTCVVSSSCDGTVAHASGPNQSTECLDSQRFEPLEIRTITSEIKNLARIETAPIHNNHSSTFPTEKSIHTSYEFPFPSEKYSGPSHPKNAKAEAVQPRAAARIQPSPVFGRFRGRNENFRNNSQATMGSPSQSQRGFLSTPYDEFPQTPTPKPLAPPSPLSPKSESENENSAILVTAHQTPHQTPHRAVPLLLSPEKPRVMPPERPRASNPSQPPAQQRIAPVEASRGAGEALPVTPPNLTAILDVIEQSKARSRAAIEARFQKARTKERKKENLTSDKAYRSQKPGALRIEQAWREEMAIAFPDLPQIAWFKREQGKLLARKEGKLIADLIDGYAGDEAAVENLVRGFVVHWDTFGPMLTKTKDGTPTIGLLYACHASVMVELRRVAKSPTKATHTEYADWLASVGKDPFASPPPEMLAMHKASRAKNPK